MRNPNKNILHLLVTGLLAVFLLAPVVYGKALPVDFDAGRNRLIGYILSHQLPAQHYAHKELDQITSPAFDLYIKQLDARKRFLLKEDINILQQYSDQIDDELRKGRVELPDVGMRLLNARIREVQKIT